MMCSNPGSHNKTAKAPQEFGELFVSVKSEKNLD